MNNTTHETNTNNTHNVKGEKLLKLIGNNIQEKLFISKLHDYKAKQKELLKTSTKLIKTHEKCIKLAKETGSTKLKNIEKIEHVVILLSL
jgi:hypothetical protein